MEKPLVSVIIPVYNADKFIDECLDSICNQSYRNIEIIAINDGSKDNSLAILRKYEAKDKRIKVIDKINGGAASARNVGIEVAHGKYITFVDADDIITCRHIEGLMTRSSYDVVSTSIVMKWNERETVLYTDESSGLSFDSICGFIGKLGVLGIGASWNKLFRSSIINSFGIRFPENQGDVCEDHIFVWQYLLKCKSYCHIDNRSYIYKENPVSLTHEKCKDNASVFIEKRLVFLLNFLNILKHCLSNKQVSKILCRYHGFFFDTIVRNLYLNNLLRKERISILNIYIQCINDSGYNAFLASEGVFNKYLSIMFRIRNLLSR